MRHLSAIGAVGLLTVGVFAQGPLVNPANGHVYIVLPASNFVVARANATLLGGYLAAVNDAAEDAWIQSNFPGSYWIGLTDATTEGTFVWDSGEPVTYTNWCPGEPSATASNHDYVEMGGQCLGQWNDINALPAFAGLVEIPFTQVLYQQNSLEASLVLDAVETDGYREPRVRKCIGLAANATLSSTLIGNPWDFGFYLQGLVPGVVGNGFVTTGNQVVNLDLGGTIFFLNGGAVPNFSSTSFPGSVTLPVNAANPLLASGQMVVIAPGTVDGFALSQGMELEFVPGSPTVVPGPAGDDSFVAVNTASPLCAFGPLQFYGTTYSQFFVSSNGEITFSLSSTDFTPTDTEMVTQMPRVAGMWSDFAPNQAGSISIIPNPTDVTVQYSAVQSWNLPGVLNSVDVVFDAAGSLTITNYAPGVGHTIGTIVGISNGSLGNPGTSISIAPLQGLGPQVGLSPMDPVFEYTAGGAVVGGWNSLTFPMSDGSLFIVN